MYVSLSKMDENLKDLKNLLRSIVAGSNYKVDVHSLEQDYRILMGCSLPYKEYGYQDAVSFLRSTCKDCFVFEGRSANPLVIPIVPDHGQRQKDTKSKKKGVSIKMSSDEPEYVEIISTGGAIKKVPQKGIRSIEKPFLKELEREIYHLIQETRGGVLCDDFMWLYRERFGRELDFERAGFTNLMGLLKRIRGICLLPETDGLRAFIASSSVSGRVQSPLPKHMDGVLRANPDNEMRCAFSDSAEIPSDCMQQMDSIPLLWLSDVGVGAKMEVTMCHIYSPSHFWVQLVHLSQYFNGIKQSMHVYYELDDNGAHMMPRSAVRLGLYCASSYRKEWRRSVIVKIVEPDNIKVRHVDYGSIQTTHAAELRPLLRQYGTLPAQAVRTRLAGLRPAAGAWDWSYEATAYFISLVQNTTFIANVFAVKPEEFTIETLLVRAVGGYVIDVTARMISANYAEARTDQAHGTGDSYLLPSFDMLESDAPIYTDMHKKRGAGISPEYRYYGVPALSNLLDQSTTPRSSPQCLETATQTNSPPLYARSASPGPEIARLPVLPLDTTPHTDSSHFSARPYLDPHVRVNARISELRQLIETAPQMNSPPPLVARSASPAPEIASLSVLPLDTTSQTDSSQVSARSYLDPPTRVNARISELRQLIETSPQINSPSLYARSASPASEIARLTVRPLDTTLQTDSSHLSARSYLEPHVRVNARISELRQLIETPPQTITLPLTLRSSPESRNPSINNTLALVEPVSTTPTQVPVNVVQLSVEECRMFAVLDGQDSDTAYFYISRALRRACERAGVSLSPNAEM